METQGVNSRAGVGTWAHPLPKNSLLLPLAWDAGSPATAKFSDTESITLYSKLFGINYLGFPYI